eukprot:2182914-Rhodomonas_salina.4
MPEVTLPCIAMHATRPTSQSRTSHRTRGGSAAEAACKGADQEELVEGRHAGALEHVTRGLPAFPPDTSVLPPQTAPLPQLPCKSAC